MNQFSFNVLLKFLCDQFATTFIFCLLGSISREVYERKKTDSRSNKNRKNKKVHSINASAFLISTVFSTILACVCADYIKIELHVAVYLLICIVLGIWGKTIMECLMNTKFLYNFCTNMVKSIANPILKGIVESASKTMEEADKEKQLADKQKENKEK